MSQPAAKKNSVDIYDETGNTLIGLTISRYVVSGQLYANSFRAHVTGLDEQVVPAKVIIGWDVEISKGWQHREQAIRLEQYYILLYGFDTPRLDRLALLEARQEIESRRELVLSQAPEALNLLDTLYYQAQRPEASYKETRQRLESQVSPYDFTVALAECHNVGGAETTNNGSMRHVLIPYPVTK